MRLLKQHIVPLALALGFCFLAWTFRTGKTQKQASSKAKANIAYMADLSAEDGREVIRQRVATGGLLLLGSSELSGGEQQFMPYNYFNQGVKSSHTALGHAGTQCFLIHFALLPLAGELKGAKITVVLAPSWFNYFPEGSNPANFVANSHEKDLYDIYFNEHLRQEDRMVMAQYIHRHYSTFNHPQTIVNVFYSLYKAHTQKVNLPAWLNHQLLQEYAAIKHKKYFQSSGSNSSYAKQMKPFDAGDYVLPAGDYKNKRDAFLASAAGNKIYVNDEYYNQYLAKEPFKKVDAFAYDTTQEWQDFKNLVDFLDHEKADVLFVIPPLNPYYYTNVEVYQPLVTAMCRQIRDRGMTVYNMFVTKRKDYRPGTLRDIMHLGENGWMQVDSAIINHYGKKDPLHTN